MEVLVPSVIDEAVAQFHSGLGVVLQKLTEDRLLLQEEK